jgi:hypothetical protein
MLSTFRKGTRYKIEDYHSHNTVQDCGRNEKIVSQLPLIKEIFEDVVQDAGLI